MPRPPRPGIRWRALALLAILLAAAACSSQAPILVGLAGPLSDPVGAPMQRAARLAIEEINAAGGVAGRPIELVEYDDYGHPDSAVAVASTLRLTGVVAVIGHVWSGTTLAAAAVYGSGSDPVPVISPSSSAPEVTAAGPHVFRVCPTDDAHGTALAQWALRGIGATRAAVLYLNDDYGRGIRRSFETTFARLGGEIVSTNPYLDVRSDAGPFLDLLARDRQAEVLLVAGDRREALEILAQARARGLTIPVLGGDGLEGIEADGPLAEGVFVSTAWLPDGREPRAQRFLDAYAARYPGEGVPNQPAAAAYDIAHLLAGALRTAGTDRARLLEALAEIGRSVAEHPGVTGLIGFTERRDLARGSTVISVVREGRLVRAEAR